MTSNIGSDMIMEKMKDSKSANINDLRKDLEKEIMPIMGKFFRPEFLNRVDDIIIFNPISDEALKAIVDIKIQNYVEMLAKDKEINISLTDEAKDFLARM